MTRRRGRILRELAYGEYTAWTAVRRCVACFEAALCEVLHGVHVAGECAACGRGAAERQAAVVMLRAVYGDQAA